MTLSREHMIALLEADGHKPTEHNLNCLEFELLLRQMGADDLLDTICYEGSPAWHAAKEHDAMMACGGGRSASEQPSSKE